MLEVRGDSMIGEGIHEGDMVVFERRSNARNGQTVVALLRGRRHAEAVFERKPRPAEAANSRYSPIFSRDVDIQGVVIGIIRRY